MSHSFLDVVVDKACNLENLARIDNAWFTHKSSDKQANKQPTDTRVYNRQQTA